MKYPMTSLEIENTTFLLVVQYLNQLRYRVLHAFIPVHRPWRPIGFCYVEAATLSRK
jgi:hypothetical protein